MTARTHAEADVLHLGCGHDQPADVWNVDAVADVNPDQVVDIDDYPWPWPNNSFREVRAYHVLEHVGDIERSLREIKSVLKPGGVAIVRVPMGNDAVADPDHSWGNGNPWTWRTPLFYTGERHWDVDVGLSVADRTVDVWPLYHTATMRGLVGAYWNAKLAAFGPGEWAFELTPMSGEFEVRFINE